MWLVTLMTRVDKEDFGLSFRNQYIVETLAIYLDIKFIGISIDM